MKQIVTLEQVTKVVLKVNNWCDARYKQEYSHTLSKKLLEEERGELFVALYSGYPVTTQHVIGRLDAIGDTTFVIIGILWKMKIDIKDVETLFYLLFNSRNIDECNQACRAFKQKVKKYYVLSRQKESMIICACTQLVTNAHILMHHYLFCAYIDILNAICVSNDTKDVPSEKVDSNKKANIVKGKNYIPPTNDILAIMQKFNVRGQNE